MKKQETPAQAAPMQPFDCSAEKQLNCRYVENEGRTLLLYRFVSKFNKYILGARDYGTGELVGLMEVHWLTLIADEPGITATALAANWQCTLGAASQVVKKLESKGLIHRCKEDGNAKVMHLYATEKGEQLSRAHKKYDTRDCKDDEQQLTAYCTAEEINAFYKVMRTFVDIMDKNREE